MRTMLVLVTTLATAGCSLGMKKLPKEWDGTTEPVCSSTYLAPTGDGLLAAVGLGVGAAAIEQEDSLVALPAILVGVVFGVVAIAGVQTANDCKEAKAEWRIGGAIGRASVANTGGPAPAATPPPAPVPPPAPATSPRGFYCASSSAAVAAGLCARDKADCKRARDAALAVITDITECALVETAHCFEPTPGDARCSPTAESCAAQRERAGATSPCAEAK